MQYKRTTGTNGTRILPLAYSVAFKIYGAMPNKLPSSNSADCQRYSLIISPKSNRYRQITVNPMPYGEYNRFCTFGSTRSVSVVAFSPLCLCSKIAIKVGSNSIIAIPMDKTTLVTPCTRSFRFPAQSASLRSIPIANQPITARQAIA